MQTTVFCQPSAGTDPSAQVRALLVKSCGFTEEMARSIDGKPYFPNRPDCHFSLSHTKGMVACAVSDQPVGVDVEHPRVIRPALAARCFTVQELAWAGGDQQRLLALWTRKEALLKRSGEGIRRPLEQVETIGRLDIFTGKSNGFTISVCGGFAGAAVQIVCFAEEQPF